MTEQTSFVGIADSTRPAEHAAQSNAAWRRSVTLGCVAVFLGTLALLMATDAQYGMTYDEPIYQSKSLQALAWLGLLARSPALAVSPEAIARYWSAKDQHPGFYKLVTAICGVTLGSLVPANAALRTGTNLLCALGFSGLFAFVAGIWGRAAALYAVGALLLMPRVFGDCHLAALDAPVMAMSFLAVAASWWACFGGPGSQYTYRGCGWGWHLGAGVLWGLALGIKLNAFFVPFIIFPWAWVFARRQIARLALSYALLGPSLFVATWPWLWHDGWARFTEYFCFHFRHWEIGVMYFGRIYQVAPWHYPLVMTVITLPPATLALAAAGCWRLISVGRRVRDDRTRTQAAAMLLVLWAAVVNLIPSCLPTSPKYNGVRLFLPVFPFIAILAAVGFRMVLDALLKWLRPRLVLPGLDWKLALVGLFLTLLGPLMAVAKFAPYHLSYYSALIGGLPGAVRAGMEPTYWGDTYRTAALWLAQEAEPGAVIWVEPPGFMSTVQYFELGPLRPDLRFSAGPEGLAHSDYAVTQNKPTEFSDLTRHLLATQQPAFTDGVDGVPLVYVFRLRH